MKNTIDPNIILEKDIALLTIEGQVILVADLGVKVKVEEAREDLHHHLVSQVIKGVPLTIEESIPLITKDLFLMRAVDIIIVIIFQDLNMSIIQCTISIHPLFKLPFLTKAEGSTILVVGTTGKEVEAPITDIVIKDIIRIGRDLEKEAIAEVGAIVEEGLSKESHDWIRSTKITLIFKGK